MKLFIKILKSLVIPMGIILIMPIFISILNLLGLKTSNTSILVIMLITIFVSSFLLGRVTEKKGYVNGLLMGLLLILVMFIFSLLFKNSYALNSFVYYAILILDCTIGSMFGIQKKIDNK